MIKSDEETISTISDRKAGKHDFYNVKLDITSKSLVLERCKQFFNSDAPHTIFFLNAHCFNISQQNSEYRHAINKSDLLLNDGIGIRLASFLANIKIGENLNGTDLIPEILALASIEKKKIYFLGGIEGVAEKAAFRIKRLIPGIQITGYRSGYFKDQEQENLIEEINNSGAEILILGMGVPKQELWAFRNTSLLTNIKIIIAGGAILDFISGHVRRAPLWIRKIHMEWLYRLAKEPKRMWKRYIIGNFIFFFNLLRIRYFSDKNFQET
ncbi:MAG: WecB/TagA/CpsF family glycosyltransferase [Cyclobacteriaceae bacterium]